MVYQHNRNTFIHEYLLVFDHFHGNQMQINFTKIQNINSMYYDQVGVQVVSWISAEKVKLVS